MWAFRQSPPKVISVDTTQRYLNMPMADYVRDHLQSADVALTFPCYSTKMHAKPWATRAGEKDVAQGGIMLSDRTDVVPADEQRWDSNAFTMVERGGKLFDCGICDRKVFLAAVLALTRPFHAMRLPRHAHYAVSSDEEVGSIRLSVWKGVGSRRMRARTVNRRAQVLL
ncbi:hypothetical protein JIQ42_03840 [Leishmania sp. Namibia]|uniref:hypothetical protein n=1 Tax=Leishmania sp. Namibia TaxID=2802991 RepID=UPI001B505B5C|nr:hypothetical protein JIQ42_03840 [Leishmania sp. Namibia]